MTDTYTPAVRIVVVASLLLAIVTMTFATMNASRADGAHLAGPCGMFCDAAVQTNPVVQL